MMALLFVQVHVEWLVVSLSDLVCLQFMVAYSMQELLPVCKNFSLNCKLGV